MGRESEGEEEMVRDADREMTERGRRESEEEEEEGTMRYNTHAGRKIITHSQSSQCSSYYYYYYQCPPGEKPVSRPGVLTNHQHCTVL